MKLKSIILSYSPIFIQNVAITIFNTYLYKMRRRGKYFNLLEYYQNFNYNNLEYIKKNSELLQKQFLEFATTHSNWYESYQGCELKNFPILTKEDIVNNLPDIATIKEPEGHVSYTGGTTGASLKVIYTPKDVTERQAILDNFRANYGYVLGKKVAWFSGKSIIRESDIANGNCHRDDFINKIRFFSTFHISKQNFDTYWKNLIQFSPEYIVGFPSSLYDICIMAKEKNLTFKDKIKVFFPTAESMLDEQIKTIKEVLGCEIVDQYASSEGAPFILQCKQGNMHLQSNTGVFEVLNEDGEEVREGELIVTAFHTHGTPLIRYKVGDRIKLAEKNYLCSCGSSMPVVDKIIGRNNDFIWSEERGRVNLGNLSNCTKDIPGVQCFQIIQDSKDEIFILLMTTKVFTKKDEAQFILNIKERVGNKIKVNLTLVDHIPREKSGKFRIVKNSLVLSEAI